MIRINNLKLSIRADQNRLSALAARALRLTEKDLLSLRIARRSLDARNKEDILYVYSVLVQVEGDEAAILRRAGNKNALLEPPKAPLILPSLTLEQRPVVVGFGPAGMFAALSLARAGARPIVLERGRAVEQRRQDVEQFFSGGAFDPQSNVQFGEGGAGTFSDGKLTTGISSPLCGWVLEAMAAHGAPEEILYAAKPHIGTDHLTQMVRSIRQEILSLGGDVRFETTLDEIHLQKGALVAITVRHGAETETFPVSRLILACGHSARDSFALMHRHGAAMERKAFSIGARIEHRQEWISRAQYGAAYRQLEAADYKLSCHLNSGRSVYTFCMCPGGQVIAAASEAGGVVTNGMSVFARDGQNANAALLCNVEPSDFGGSDVLAGVEFQRSYEQAAFALGGLSYRAPAQTVGDFLAQTPSTSLGKVQPSYRPGVVLGDLRQCLPSFATDAMREAILLFDRRLRGYADENALLTGVETRSSSPVRMLRGKDCQSNLRGIFPCGEGAGYAGGIMSAAVDGLRCAMALWDSL